MNSEYKSGRNSFLLILTAFIWGIAFVAQSAGGDAVGPYTFNCIRSLIGGIVLLPVIKLLDYFHLTKQKPKTKKEKKNLIAGGIACGMALALASNLQQMGLYLGSSAGKAGFLTACYILIVPILGIFLKKKKVQHKYLDWNCDCCNRIVPFVYPRRFFHSAFRYPPAALCIFICHTYLSYRPFYCIGRGSALILHPVFRMRRPLLHPYVLYGYGTFFLWNTGMDSGPFKPLRLDSHTVRRRSVLRRGLYFADSRAAGGKSHGCLPIDEPGVCVLCTGRLGAFGGVLVPPGTPWVRADIWSGNFSPDTKQK